MKKSKFTTEQIVFGLRRAEAGLKVEETCRELGISKATFFRWKAKYGEMGTPEMRHLRMLKKVAPGRRGKPPQARREPQETLRLRLRELAASRVRFGYCRLHVLLQREGWAINVKRSTASTAWSG